jgi:hypothetical protein
MVPPQGALARGPRPLASSVLPEERVGVWPLGPSEMTMLQEGATSAPRLERPEGSLTPLGGGGDALVQRVAPSRTSMTAPEVGAPGKSFEEVPPPPFRGPRRWPRLLEVGLLLMMLRCHLTWGLPW